ncbi:MAG: hypothetical protein ACWA5Q_06480 [bacterium]
MRELFALMCLLPMQVFATVAPPAQPPEAVPVPVTDIWGLMGIGASLVIAGLIAKKRLGK